MNTENIESENMISLLRPNVLDKFKMIDEKPVVEEPLKKFYNRLKVIYHDYLEDNIIFVIAIIAVIIFLLVLYLKNKKLKKKENFSKSASRKEKEKLKTNIDNPITVKDSEIDYNDLNQREKFELLAHKFF